MAPLPPPPGLTLLRYAWGQQPDAYVAKFRAFATAVKRSAPRVEVAWTPNHEGGYPWGGCSAGAAAAACTASDAVAMDTNGDGAVDAGDDSWLPFWPGAECVARGRGRRRERRRRRPAVACDSLTCQPVTP